MGILSFVTFSPLVGALVLLAVPKENIKAIRTVALATMGMTFAATLYLLGAFHLGDAQHIDALPMQFVENFNWIETFHIHYSMGIDGLSFPLVILTSFVCLLAGIYALNIELRVKEFFFWFLILEMAMIGVFCALDMFLFYVFWEITLVPMYFLIGIWGGPKKEYAAIKFFLFTLFGSVFMLLGILALYFKAGETFDMMELMAKQHQWSTEFQIVVFIAFYLGLSVKIPAFPFHTWLPLAHVEAPTPVSVILAAVLLKMGVYGLLRISYSILPAGFEWFMPILIVIAFINILYGALCAMAQNDMKKMVAYSSINHMGYCLLGIASVTPTGFNGAVLQMINHGIITGALFMLVGVIYDRAHTRDLTAFGGLGAKLPVFAGLMTLTAMASLGLPGLAGFVSEFLCFLGAFPVWQFWTILSVSGILVTAAFFLRMLQKVFMGPLNEKWSALPDMNVRELLAVGPLAVMTVVLGIWPRLALDYMNPTIKYIATLYPELFK